MRHTNIGILDIVGKSMTKLQRLDIDDMRDQRDGKDVTWKALHQQLVSLIPLTLHGHSPTSSSSSVDIDSHSTKDDNDDGKGRNNIGQLCHLSTRFRLPYEDISISVLSLIPELTSLTCHNINRIKRFITISHDMSYHIN
jgi:hypothetical protein